MENSAPAAGKTPGPRASLLATARERRGVIVRDARVAWAASQPDPGGDWLTPWDELCEDQREADMTVGDVLAGRYAALLAAIRDLLRSEPTDLVYRHRHRISLAIDQVLSSGADPVQVAAALNADSPAVVL